MLKHTHLFLFFVSFFSAISGMEPYLINLQKVTELREARKGNGLESHDPNKHDFVYSMSNIHEKQIYTCYSNVYEGGVLKFNLSKARSTFYELPQECQLQQAGHITAIHILDKDQLVVANNRKKDSKIFFVRENSENEQSLKLDLVSTCKPNQLTKNDHIITFSSSTDDLIGLSKDGYIFIWKKEDIFQKNYAFTDLGKYPLSSINPLGKICACNTPGNLVVIDLKNPTKNQFYALESFNDEIGSLQLSHDGTLVAVVTKDKKRHAIYDFNKQLLRELELDDSDENVDTILPVTAESYFTISKEVIKFFTNKKKLQQIGDIYTKKHVLDASDETLYVLEIAESCQNYHQIYKIIEVVENSWKNFIRKRWYYLLTFFAATTLLTYKLIPFAYAK